MKNITIENAVKLIKSTNGSIFSVDFIKNDGHFRTMTCRLGVSKGIKGKGLKFDPHEYDLMTVFDMQANGYRMIKLNTLYSLTVDGQRYSVTQ